MIHLPKGEWRREREREGLFLSSAVEAASSSFEGAKGGEGETEKVRASEASAFRMREPI
jgi:hypothetical protein